MTSLKSKRGAGHLLPYSLWKSVFDRVMSLVMVVALSPVLALVAIAVRLDSPGSPIFAQERVGKDGRRFIAYKFRTMHINNDDGKYKAYLEKYVLENAPYQVDENGQGIYKVVNDPRITRLGTWLRKTNLDDLPQVFNVLKGEMSFIGPRPDVPFAVRMYQDWQRERLNVLPGMTGLWQVSHRTKLAFDDMVRLDIDYIKQQSMFLDTKILLLTVKTVLIGDGS